LSFDFRVDLSAIEITDAKESIWVNVDELPTGKEAVGNAVGGQLQ